jgi:hypothetical protein
MYHRKPVEKTRLDEVIDQALSELAGHDANTEEYAEIVKRVAELNALRDTNKSDRLSKDTLALILGNLAGILVIVSYEHIHVMTSKALPFLHKLTP